MHILCFFGSHKLVKKDPEKGIMSEVRCGRKCCGELISPEINWPPPPPPIQPFFENPKCMVCHSTNISTYFCNGLRYDLHLLFTDSKCNYGYKGHLHRKCSCGFGWAEKTAVDSNLEEGK